MTSRSATANVYVLALCQALLNTTGSMLAAVSALVGASLADQGALATLPVTLTVVGTALGTVPASMLMKWTGRRAGFLLGAGIGLLGALAAGQAILAASFAGFCVGTFLLGVFTAFGNYYRFAAADAAPPQFRSRAISYVLAGGVIAGFAGPALAKTTRGAVGDAQFVGCFYAIAGLAVLTAVLVSLIRVPRAGADHAEQQRPLREIARQRSFLIAVIGAATGTAVMVLVMTATPLAIIGHHHGFDDSATVIQWHVVAMFAPSFVTGSLVARYGTARMMFVGLGCLAAAGGVALGGTTLAVFVVALILLGIGWNFLFVAGSALLTTTHSDAERAKTQALNDFVVYGAAAVASLSSGTVLQYLGWRGVNGLALAVLAVVSVLAVVAVLRDRAARDPRAT